MDSSKRIEKLTLLYYSLLICWMIFFIYLTISLGCHPSNMLSFVMGLVFYFWVDTSTRAFRKNLPVWISIAWIWVMVFCFIGLFAMNRQAGVSLYAEIHDYEAYHNVSLLPPDAPSHLEAFGLFFFILCVVGFLFCLVASIYYFKEGRNRVREPMISYRWHQYLNPFRMRVRVVFLGLALLLIALIVYLRSVAGYAGAFTRMPGLIAIMAILFVFFADHESQQLRSGVYAAIVFFTLLEFVVQKQLALLSYTWHTSIEVDVATLTSTTVLGHDMEFLETLRHYIVFPPFRGNHLLLFPPESVPEAFSWKDFILVIPVGLYMLLNVKFEPQLERVESETESP